MATDVDQITYAYAADIAKSEATPEGHLMVHGKAASPTLDLDGQICDPGWLAREMPAWFEWGNVRAEHKMICAGVGKQLEADGADGWDLGALIVDTDAKEKIKHDVYKGFSVGIKGARVIKDKLAPNGRIVGGKIIEVSLVDRPCNPDAKMTIVKSAGTFTAFEDPGDPESDVVESEILAPTDEAGELIEPDELTDDEEAELSDIVKGFIEFLRGPKPKKPAKGRDSHKRDQSGKFAHTEARQNARDAQLTTRERALVEHQKELNDRKADVARATMENALSSEALADAEHARREGRTEEAQEHAHAAASHATDSSHRSRVRREYTAIGKGADVDDVRGWGDATTEALEYIVKAASAELAARDGGPDLIKSLLPDVVKRDFTTDERREMADEGNAMPDGTYPIKTQNDLDNAHKLAGSSKTYSKERVHAHIRAMAKKHGLTLPDEMTEKAAGVDAADGAIVIGELNKAAEAKLGALEADNASLRDRLAKVESLLSKTAAPDAFAPVLVRQTTLRSAPSQVSAVERARRDAERMTDPAAQRAAMAYAESLEGRSLT